MVDQNETERAVRDHRAQAVLAEQPPEFLIDLLGRRSLCLDMLDGSGGKPPEDGPDLEEWRQRRCEAVGADEARVRATHAGDAEVLLWLNQNPRKFTLGQIVVTSHRPRAPDVRRFEQAGVDPLTNTTFRVSLEAVSGRWTQVTARFGKASRTVRISSARYPRLDWNSLRVGFGPQTRTEYLTFEMYYGFDRPYCWDGQDTRARLSIDVSRGGSLSGSRQRNINCRSDYEELASSDFPALDE